MHVYRNDQGSESVTSHDSSVVHNVLRSNFAESIVTKFYLLTYTLCRGHDIESVVVL